MPLSITLQDFTSSFGVVPILVLPSLSAISQVASALSPDMLWKGNGVSRFRAQQVDADVHFLCGRGIGKPNRFLLDLVGAVGKRFRHRLVHQFILRVLVRGHAILTVGGISRSRHVVGSGERIVTCRRDLLIPTTYSVSRPHPSSLFPISAFYLSPSRNQLVLRRQIC